MELALKKSILDLNQGFINAIKGRGKPSIRYHDRYIDFVNTYEQNDTFFINSTKSDIDFSLNINGVIDNTIKVSCGYIGAKAVAIRKSKLFTTFGAIELKIKKEQIGQLYMRVKAGVILANSDLIKINQYGTSGCEGFFNGNLSNQRTELLVDAGAIVCTID